jgi:hypothetical protein
MVTHQNIDTYWYINLIHYVVVCIFMFLSLLDLIHYMYLQIKIVDVFKMSWSLIKIISQIFFLFI